MQPEARDTRPRPVQSNSGEGWRSLNACADALNAERKARGYPCRLNAGNVRDAIDAGKGVDGRVLSFAPVPERPPAAPMCKRPAGKSIHPKGSWRGIRRGAALLKLAPVGIVRVVRKGRRSYRLIKIRADGPRSKRWAYLGRVVWEAAHGPIPAGKRLCYLDNDPLNEELSNLKPMTPGEALQLRLTPAKERRRIEKAIKGRKKQAALLRAEREFCAVKLAEALPTEPEPEPETASGKARRKIADFLKTLEAAA